MDRISDLPNEIWGHVLSFVPTTAAVKTSVLSRRWQNIWVLARGLSFFDDYTYSNEEEKNSQEVCFMNFVSKVLLCVECECLKSFYVSRTQADLDYDFNFVNTWICAVIKLRVQNLSLHYVRNELQAVSLPHMLFKSTNLVVLRLGGDVLLQVPNLVSLPSLKELYLHQIHYENNDSASKLFAACPVLEKLVIIRALYDNMLVLNISIDTLKSLHLVFPFPAPIGYVAPESYKEGMSRTLIVNAPMLEDFHLEDFVSEFFFLSNLRSLSKAFVDFGARWKNHVSEDSTAKLFSGIRSVKILSFTAQMMEYLACYYKGKPPTFDNLVHLEVGDLDASCWKKLFEFLENSPELQVLSIGEAATRPISRLCGNWTPPEHAPTWPISGIYGNCTEPGHATPWLFSELCGNWTPPEHVPKCLLSQLKEIVMKEYRGNGLEAVRYTVTNGKVLEEIRIQSAGMEQHIINEIEKKLKRLRMASNKCKIIFNGKTLEAIKDSRR